MRHKTLYIKNPEAYRLAKAIADETSETLASAVISALREHYERVQRRSGKASFEELRAIAKRVAAHIKGPYLDHAAYLFDGHGLPK